MSNTSIGVARKGSKFMMQIVSSKLAKRILDNYFDDDLRWLSPREDDNYEEYQLSHTKVLDFLGINNQKKELFSFWPTRQPQWDGIAIGRDRGRLYLFEAKSHIRETISDCTASSVESKTLIKNTIMNIAKQVYHMENEDIIDKFWLKKNYQIANRLVFLQKMKEIQRYAALYDDVQLVLLNFVNDFTWDEKEVVTDASTWTEHYNKIFKEMNITREQVKKEGLIELNYQAPHIK